MIDVKDLIRLKKLEEKAVTVKEKWCEEHQTDIQQFFETLDDLLASAVASNSSQQAYTEFRNLKSKFDKAFIEMSGRYRLI